MKKYDVIFRARRVRYIERIEASTKESAKNKILKKYDDIEKITMVKDAEDYICYTYKSVKTKDGSFGFEQRYHGGYLELPMFGYAHKLESTQDQAKRFQTEQELKRELKMLGETINQYKIEKIKAK